ncbi:hypothetical protein NDU88_002545 [Pleurodeles waltl]|uniref:Uncharacterized protein n=1 Tax=Pleurodeles waltl TaxID=8319 RepID=A0AAV7RE40_PLEWA|nr:hypothetical protein NDU88_002545 [Pleurodeles waltl]
MVIHRPLPLPQPRLSHPLELETQGSGTEQPGDKGHMANWLSSKTYAIYAKSNDLIEDAHMTRILSAPPLHEQTPPCRSPVPGPGKFGQFCPIHAALDGRTDLEHARPVRFICEGSVRAGGGNEAAGTYLGVFGYVAPLLGAGSREPATWRCLLLSMC